jgi:hypothetical protein
MAEFNCEQSVIISLLLSYIPVEMALIEQFQYQVMIYRPDILMNTVNTIYLSGK